jgi:hypothetical protein
MTEPGTMLRWLPAWRPASEGRLTGSPAVDRPLSINDDRPGPTIVVYLACSRPRSGR